MPDDSAEFEPAPDGVEQVLAVRTEVVPGFVEPNGSGEGQKIEVVVLALWYRAQDADPEDDPLRTFVVLPAEDARALRHQLEVADSVKTVAEQVTE